MFNCFGLTNVTPGVEKMLKYRNTMKILHLIDTFGIGGMENVLINLINKMNESKYNHFICCYNADDNFIQRLSRTDTDITILKKRKGNDLTIPFKIAKICNRKQIDIIHARGWTMYAEGLLASKISPSVKGFIYGFHGKTFEDVLNKKRRRMFMEWFLARFTARIVTLSEGMRDDYASSVYIRKKRITVINNGIDIQKFSKKIDKNKIRKKFGISPEEIVLGCVARLDPVKDLITLLKGYKMAQKCKADISLLIVGDGPCMDQIKKISCKFKLKNKIIFTGMRNNIPELLQLMDVYVQTSLYEGMSNTILEAMAAGLPVIATSVGGNNEIVIHKKTGLLIPPKEPGALSKAINCLYVDPEKRKEYGKQGHLKVKHSFSIKKMVTNYQYLYDNLYNFKN